jgi:tRNA nucleotidyltransferase (CCA-adding enzyme)
MLNGNDLKKLGYKPSPKFRQMLDDILAATLDGVVHNQEEAEDFLAKHYPV